MSVDEMLARSGDFGPAQWWLLSFFCMVNVLSAFHYFAQTFISLTPDVDCEAQDWNCTWYNENRGCRSLTERSGWNFETVTTELGWVCDDNWKTAVVQSWFFIGSVIGTLSLGILADILGRLPMLALANLLAVVGNLLTVFVEPSIWGLSASRFVAGLATDTNFFMMYIIVMEYIRPSMRTFGLNLCIGVWYCVGCMVTPWLALGTGDWRSFLLTISIPMLAIPTLSYFVPESAQWLLSRGKVDDAIKCFKKVAVYNNKEISKDFIADFQRASASFTNASNQTASLTGLFKTPRLRRKTFILIFKTMVLTLCYDAMSRNIEGLGLDPFTMFTITSASIFPSCVVILILQDKVGRKLMAVLALFLTGVFNLAQGTFLAYSTEMTYIGAVIGLLGRFSVNIAYNSGTQYAAELIPTQVRGQGLASIHVVGYAAAFFSPHILYLSNKWVAMPEIILAVLSITGSAFCLFLPETLNKSLPATLEDGEAFGENENMWDFLKKNKKINSTMSTTTESTVVS